MSLSIKDRKTIVHLTALKNLESIFLHGLLPRSMMSPTIDIADQEILKKRKLARLDNYVAFHFFMKNPFAGAVMEVSQEKFVYLSVLRENAKKNNFLILPKHPLYNSDRIELFSYDEGIEKINWELMDKRSYEDHECKNVCMAECLSPNIVPLPLIHSIIVPDKNTYKIVYELKVKYSYAGFIDVKNSCFI